MGANSVIESSPHVLGGTPVFKGTRVSVQAFIDHLEAGDTLDAFLDQFPTVKREQAIAALELAKQVLIRSADEAATG